MDFKSANQTPYQAGLDGDLFALPLSAMVFESLLAFPRTLTTDKRGTASSALALDGPTGDVYEEEAFRHFLAVERTRAERAEYSSLLLLVSLRRCPQRGAAVPRAISPTLLSGLGLCVREVDFIGWYRQGRVAGAVLTQGLQPLDVDAPHRIVARVTKTLAERLPRSIAERLRVRVVRLGRKGNS